MEMKQFLAHQVVKSAALKKDVRQIPIVQLDFDAKAQPQLVKALKMAEQKRRKIASAMIIRDIKGFADEIAGVGQQFQCDALVLWGRRLKEQASNFKKTEMEAMLQGYPAIVATIEKETNRHE